MHISQYCVSRSSNFGISSTFFPLHELQHGHTHALGFAAGSWPLRQRCATRRGQASTVISKVRPIDGRGIHVLCKYDNLTSHG